MKMNRRTAIDRKSVKIKQMRDASVETLVFSFR